MRILLYTAFSVSLGLGIIVPIMPIYIEGYGVSGIWLGIVISSFALARMIFTPLIGRSSDVRGRKTYIILGLVFYGIFSIAHILAENVYQLTLVRFIHGASAAMVLPIVMAYVGDLSVKGEEGKHMALFNTFMFAGIGVGPFLGGVISDLFGVPWAFITTGALAFFGVVIVLSYLPKTKISSSQKSRVSLRFVLRNNVVRGLISFRIVSAMGRAGIYAFLPVFATLIGLSISEIGIVIAGNVLIMSILQLPFGRLADSFSRIKLVLMGNFLSSFSLLLMPFSQNFIELFTIGLVMGLGGAISIPSSTAISASVGRNIGMGSVIGLYDTSMSIGWVIGPLLAGFIMDYYGIDLIFYCSTVIILIGTFFFYYFVKKEKVK